MGGNLMEGDQEKEIGVVYKTPGSRCRVSLLRKPDGTTYVVIANQYNTKKTNGWYTKRATYIPFHSASQIAALIGKAIKEGWRLYWN